MNPPEGNRSIHGCWRWALWLCVLGWVLPGCGRSAPTPAEARVEAASSETGGDRAASPSNKEGVRAEAEPANATEDPAPPVPKPATLAEVRQAIDWFKSPKPDGALWEETNLLRTHYWVPGTIAQAADFYRKTLAAQGWIENKKANPGSEPDKYQSLEFAKAGFLVFLDLSGKKTHVEVHLFNLGNVDARRLPKLADAKVTAASRSYVAYATSSKPESAAESCRKGIAALGWRETPAPGAKNYAKEGITLLRFVQNAMDCKVTITRKKEGETEVIYHTYLRSEFEPADVAASLAAKNIPKPATLNEALQTLDVRKLPRLGESDFKVNTGLRAEYETRASVATAVAFYRKTLAEQGWALVPPLVDLDESGALQFEKAGFLLSLHIESLVNQVNKAGLVSIALSNHGNVDLRQLPYLPGAEISHVRQVHTQYRASATVEAAAAFYRKELAQLGWQEKGKGLEFFQNDARLKIYIDTTRDGQTPIQVSAKFGGKP